MPVIPTDLLYDFAAEAAPVAQAYLVNEAPKAALQTAARGFAYAHHLGQGAISGLVGAAIMGAWRATGRGPSSGNLRGNSSRRASKPRPMEKAPRLRIAEPRSTSGSSTMAKNLKRADTPSSGLEVVERPLRLVKHKNGDRPKSVWSSLRDMVSGKKVLKNTFSFKMTSDRDKRGLMAIPIRHDANLPFEGSDWTVGAQSSVNVAATDGYNAYTTMLSTPKQETYTARPLPGVQNIIIPRLNLPTLEQTSWDLNCLKLLPGDDLMETIQDAAGNHQTMTKPVIQLGGSAVPHLYSLNPADRPTINNLPNDYPAAQTSYPRKQSVSVQTGDPNTKTLYSMPRFKTQLGGGSLQMRMCNQGTNSCTVEFVVVKVANPYVATYTPDLYTTQIVDGGDKCNMTKTWANLYDTVGWEHQKKVQSNLSYAMGTQPVDLEQLQLEPISNPYKPWLPDSCFKAHYDNTDQYSGVDYSNAGGLTASTTSAYQPDTYNPLATTSGFVNNDAIPFNKVGGAGQKTPYRVVNRGHCSISGAAERNITIPIPGSNYDASKIQSTAQTMDTVATEVDGAANALMSDQSYIVLMSVNGSLQDIIEPQIDASGNSTGNIKVIGKAYTSAALDCYCQYTETVYPSHCDYAAMGPVAYNLGTARTEQLKSSIHAYPGKVMAMADAIPVTQAGVLRTGAKDRAGDNAGSI